jgi:hypothetical protein
VNTNGKKDRDTAAYRARPVKRQRRTKEEVRQFESQLSEALKDCHPNSVRHVFYLMTNPRLAAPVEKTERGARHVQERLVKMRRQGKIPYSWVVDMSRRGYHVVTYKGAAEFLRDMTGLYRADLWGQADVYVEVWCESRSIAGVILGVCEELAVSLYPAGGNSSISFAYEAAMNIKACHEGKPVIILYVGDYDRAGVIIDAALEREIRLHLGPDVDVTFVRVAITKEQIELYDLPTKPPNEEDKRALHVTETVEAEAMPPALLCDLLRAEIESHLPPRALEVMKVAEENERAVLERLAESLEKKKPAASRHAKG